MRDKQRTVVTDSAHWSWLCARKRHRLMSHTCDLATPGSPIKQIFRSPRVFMPSDCV